MKYETKNSKIVILGLTFKPGSSDLRGSKSFSLVNELKKRGHDFVSSFFIKSRKIAS